MKLYLITLFSLLSIGSVQSQTVEVNDHSYPKSENVYDTEWILQGTHHFKYKIFFSVFTGAYYQAAQADGERLVFTYTRDIEAEDLREQAMKHLKATQSDEVLKSYASLTEQLQNAYEDVSDGDTYAITVLPEKGIWLDRNDKTVFHSDNADFGDWYLDIWLGDPPIDKGLKKDLLTTNH